MLRLLKSKLLNYTLVIYSFRHNKLFAYCNGVFFRDKNKLYILTAEHAFSKIHPGDLQILFEGLLVSLEGEIIGNTAYDLVLFEIDQHLGLHLLEKYDFLERDQLLFNYQPKENQTHLLIGYPSSKVTVRGLNIKEIPIIYQTSATADLSQPNNIKFFYHKRKSKKPGQKGYVIAPDPVGLSGSGLWYIKLDHNNLEFKLVGIFKEFDRKKNLGTAIRVDYLREIIN